MSLFCASHNVYLTNLDLCTECVCVYMYSMHSKDLSRIPRFHNIMSCYACTAPLAPCTLKVRAYLKCIPLLVYMQVKLSRLDCGQHNYINISQQILYSCRYNVETSFYFFFNYHSDECQIATGIPLSLAQIPRLLI